MILKQYYVDCLSHASYLIADESSGEAVIVDPRRDIREYLHDAKNARCKIVGVINTHVHADFLAGHLELAAATGAWIGYGEGVRAEFDVRRLSDGERLALGEIELEILATPGHTWDSISVVVHDESMGAPRAVLTGDSLLIGGVGRPDLVVSSDSTPAELARAMYDTVHNTLLTLPDSTLVYPAHGAGSSCGQGLSKDLMSTIGRERYSNPFALAVDAAQFVALATTGQVPAPQYFATTAQLNLKNHDVLSPDRKAAPLTVTEVMTAHEGGVAIVDTRDPQEYADRHLSGSINVGIDGRFAETVGMIIDLHAEIVMVCDAERADEATVRLSSIGADNVIGYVPSRMLPELDPVTETTSRVEPHELPGPSSRFRLLDVRNATERELGAIPASLHIPLAELANRVDEVPRDAPVLVYCGSGWRSSVAASLLRRHGSAPVWDLVGGYSAWAVQH